MLEAKCGIEGYLIRFRGPQEEVPIEMNKYILLNKCSLIMNQTMWTVALLKACPVVKILALIAKCDVPDIESVDH